MNVIFDLFFACLRYLNNKVLEETKKKKKKKKSNADYILALESIW